jgi:hypothetical protein
VGRACVAALALVTLACVHPAAVRALSFAPGAEGVGVAIEGEGGKGVLTQAGAHPYAITTKIGLEGSAALQGLELELPPGLIENPAAVAKCSQAAFNTPRSSPYEESRSGESCNQLSQIGVLTVKRAGKSRSFGLFELAPPPGYPAQIGASPFGIPLVFTSRLRQAEGEYGVTLELQNLSPALDPEALAMTVWGNPWGLSHNTQRGNCLNEADPSFGWAKCPVSPPQPAHGPWAYLTLPASCGPPLSFRATATAWGDQVPASASAQSTGEEGSPAGLEGCAALHFEPLASLQISNPRASSPSGLDFTLTPKEEALTDYRLPVPSQPRSAIVTLPQGVTLNPSLAAGLGVCAPSGYAAESATSPPGQGCPENSKIGSFTVESPLFEEPIEGAVYLAQPDQNPFGSLLALYLVAKSPQRGVLVKVAGRLSADPVTGRLSADFEDLPQLPYSNLHMHLREGQRAPLATPAACGSFATRIELSPWSDPSESATSEFPFLIAKGIGPGEACPSGTPPFAPKASGGSLNGAAGAYSAFYLHLTRTDSEQEITRYSATLPEGLTGRLAGVAVCPDAAIAAAKSMSGEAEEAHPSCPANSRVGRTVTGYGLGAALAYAPGEMYLAGPYGGRPLSLVAIDSAHVGPFDLGTVVIRSAFSVDPHTGRLALDSAASDPIPHILDGIPLHLRDIRVYIDRPGFVRNPTSCEAASFGSVLGGSGTRFDDPSDDTSASVTNLFQVSDCTALGFKPKLTLRLRGRHRRGAYPALRATYRPREGDADVRSVAVTLPHTEFLAQNHIRDVCARSSFVAGSCPAGSIYGHAVAYTPLLEAPLEGPVYLRSSENPLPDLVADLHSGAIRIVLEGRVDSVGAGQIRVTFDGLPDAPLTRFVLTMKGGTRGLLVNSADPCATRARAYLRALAYNNRGAIGRPAPQARCPKARPRRQLPRRDR